MNRREFLTTVAAVPLAVRAGPPLICAGAEQIWNSRVWYQPTSAQRVFFEAQRVFFEIGLINTLSPELFEDARVDWRKMAGKL